MPRPCYRSMIFMFTNAFRNGRALQMEQVATRLRSFLESERAAYEKAFGASFRDFFNVFHFFLAILRYFWRFSTILIQ